MHIPQTEVILRHHETELVRVTLPPGEYVIGRERAADIFAETPLLSRRHAMLTINYDSLLLEDLGSSNGTFIADQPVTQATRLFPNQSIRLGPDISLEVRRERATVSPEMSLAPAQAAIRRFVPDEVLADKRYAIGSQVARGGMGAILDAEQAAMKRHVAMKVMLDGADPGDIARFVDEAQITGRLEHPNIVPVHELGVDEQGQLFYTMKFVRGITLKKVLELLTEGIPETVKKYSLPALLTIFQKACDAIAFAHSKGVIHRDLKPENIMLGDFGEVLVMDWGLAKVLAKNETADITRSLVTSARTAEPEFGSTMAGAIMGTPQYMSPEQARGEVETLDARSDVYALGTILFELLHQRPVVTGTDAMAIVEKVQRGEVEWGAHAPSRAVSGALAGERVQAASSTPAEPAADGRGRPAQHARARVLPIPDSLLAVCRKALAFDRDQRYRGVGELQRDIAAFQGGFATGAEKAGLARQLALLIKRHRGMFATAFAAWLLLMALGAWFVVKVTHERNRAERALGDLRATAPTFLGQARALIEAGKFSEALEKTDFALSLTPGDAGAFALKGNILQSLGRFPEARAAFAVAAQRDGAFPFTAENVALSEKLARESADSSGELSVASVRELHTALLKQKRTAEAVAVLSRMQKGDALDRALLKTWQAKCALAYGENKVGLTLAGPGLLQIDFNSNNAINDLRPLQGAPISVLKLGMTSVRDLSPLAEMPLDYVDLSQTQVSDLTPLRACPLRVLLMDSTQITDLTPLAGKQLTSLALKSSKVEDISPLRGMPLEELYLKDTKVTDWSPIRGMPLKRLVTNGLFPDLRLLRGMPLEDLDISYTTRITELSALKGLRLKTLTAAYAHISDLNGLQGMPLESLAIHGCPIRDISPLRGVQLNWLSVGFTKVANIEALRGMPLHFLAVRNTLVTSLDVLRGMPLRQLLIENTPQHADIRILAELPTLEWLTISRNDTDIEFLRKLPNLTRISFEWAVDKPAKTASEFWKEYDAQKAAGKK